jgi:hypothetical protein
MIASSYAVGMCWDRCKLTVCMLAADSKQANRMQAMQYKKSRHAANMKAGRAGRAGRAGSMYVPLLAPSGL